MRKHGTRIALLAFTFALALATTPGQAGEEDFQAVVTHVFDGDSFLVRPLSPRSKTPDINVRLTDIDAPEKDQPYANTARSALIRLIEGRRVFVDVIEIDRYDRKIAKVYREPDRLEVARALVHAGHVWVNRKYAGDHSLIVLEDTAKSKRAGLWSLPADQLVPPWQFRKAKRRSEEPQKNTKKN
jgi:micrococcal nuclease